MSRFVIEELPLAGAALVSRSCFKDSRGSFGRVFCEEELQSLFFGQAISQINLSVTNEKGTVRGLHFQHPPHAEKKLVSCLKGEIMDVAVDLRKDSETFLCWHAETLSRENGRAMFLPEGFAHGFQSLTEEVEILYLHTCSYEPDSEGAIHPLDEAVGVKWPLPISSISERDSSHPKLPTSFRGIEV